MYFDTNEIKLIPSGIWEFKIVNTDYQEGDPKATKLNIYYDTFGPEIGVWKKRMNQVDRPYYYPRIQFNLREGRAALKTFIQILANLNPDHAETLLAASASKEESAKKLIGMNFWGVMNQIRSVKTEFPNGAGFCPIRTNNQLANVFDPNSGDFWCASEVGLWLEADKDYQNLGPIKPQADELSELFGG